MRPSAVLLAAALVAPACAPRGQRTDSGPAPLPVATSWPVTNNRDGELVTRDGLTTYRDRAVELSLGVPPGFQARLRFPLDLSGPPAAGRLLLRMTDAAEPPCVIDVGTEPRSDPSTREATIAQGREVFYLAETGQPLPEAMESVDGLEVWAATLVPRDPLRIDVGYWVLARDLLVRVEGRFPVDRMAGCKEALDAVIRSLSIGSRAEAEASGGAAQSLIRSR